MNKLYLIVPAMCDLITSTLQFIALNFISASAFQMITGGDIVTCFIFSIILLKQPIYRAQIVGSVLAVMGVAIVGIANIINNDES